LNIAQLVEGEHLQPPAVTVIGEVVNLRGQLNWFEQQPLFGKRIVLTQRRDLQRELAQALRDSGAEVWEIPASQCVSRPDPDLLARSLAKLTTYDWIIFSNPYAVDHFLQHLLAAHGDLRALGPAKIGTFGPVTAARLQAWHLKPTVAPSHHQSAVILQAILGAGEIEGRKFLLVRGEAATENLPEALRQHGARVEVLPIFAIEPAQTLSEETEKFTQEGADWIVFASGSSLEHFHKRFDLPAALKRFPQTRIAIANSAIQGALAKLGLKPSVIGQPNDVQRLVNGILKAETKSSKSKPNA